MDSIGITVLVIIGVVNGRTHCRRGHQYLPNTFVVRKIKRWGRVYDVKVCKVCRTLRKKERKYGTGLLPTDFNPFHIGALKAWETKRARYGGNGLSEKTRQKMSRATSRRLKFHHHFRNKTHCVNGHRYLTRTTTINRKGARECLICIKNRKRRQLRRPVWIEFKGGRVSLLDHDRAYLRSMYRLRHDMIWSHPDKPGGTATKFRLARAIFERFRDMEAKWYAIFNLEPPKLREFPGVLIDKKTAT